MKKAFLALSIALGLSGCVYSQVGSRFDISKANELTAGVSTEQDAINLFGKPLSITTNPETNAQLLVWQYAYGTAIGVGGGAKLAIAFAADGRMLKIIQETKI